MVILLDQLNKIKDCFAKRLQQYTLIPFIIDFKINSQITVCDMNDMMAITFDASANMQTFFSGKACVSIKCCIT